MIITKLSLPRRTFLRGAKERSQLHRNAARLLNIEIPRMPD